jgi:hypothetical protein
MNLGTVYDLRRVAVEPFDQLEFTDSPVPGRDHKHRLAINIEQNTLRYFAKFGSHSCRGVSRSSRARPKPVNIGGNTRWNRRGYESLRCV